VYVNWRVKLATNWANPPPIAIRSPFPHASSCIVTSLGYALTVSLDLAQKHRYADSTVKKWSIGPFIFTSFVPSRSACAITIASYHQIGVRLLLASFSKLFRLNDTKISFRILITYSIRRVGGTWSFPVAPRGGGIEWGSLLRSTSLTPSRQHCIILLLGLLSAQATKQLVAVSFTANCVNKSMIGFALLLRR
jgi:hypothetical protein